MAVQTPLRARRSMQRWGSHPSSIATRICSISSFGIEPISVRSFTLRAANLSSEPSDFAYATTRATSSSSSRSSSLTSSGGMGLFIALPSLARHVMVPAKSLGPMSVVSPSLNEREKICRGLEAGKSFRAIAQQLGRSPSSVSRRGLACTCHRNIRWLPGAASGVLRKPVETTGSR